MKAHTQEKAHPLERERGQGLVEMVLVLPFLLVLLVGVVEAGVALNRQLTVINAAREGARFGAFGAKADDIYQETKDATSDMFDFEVDNSVVVVINAETNDNCNAFDEWSEEIYPTGAAVPHVTQAEVLQELQQEGNCGNLKVVVVDVRYDHQSMLGLPFVGALADEIPIGSWTVMRLAAPRSGEGNCYVYPIGIDDDEIPDLSDADGDWVLEREAGVPGGFGWLQWKDEPQCGSAQAMRDCLADPAGCLAGYDPPPGNCPGGYDNPSDSEDHELDEGDDVSGNPGLAATNVHDVPKKYIRVVVYESVEGGGQHVVYKNVRFAIIEVIDTGTHQGNARLKARFIRFDNTGCQ